MKNVIIVLLALLCLNVSAQFGYTNLAANQGVSFTDLNDAIKSGVLISTGTTFANSNQIIQKSQVASYVQIVANNSTYAPKASNQSIEKQDLTAAALFNNTDSFYSPGPNKGGAIVWNASDACAQPIDSWHSSQIAYYTGTIGNSARVYGASTGGTIYPNTSTYYYSKGSNASFQLAVDPATNAAYITNWASCITLKNVYITASMVGDNGGITTFECYAYSDAGHTNSIKVDTDVTVYLSLTDVDGDNIGFNVIIPTGYPAGSNTYNFNNLNSRYQDFNLGGINPIKSSTQNYIIN